MNTIYVVEHHDQVLLRMRELGHRRRCVLHLDFHCDLRGLMIDRRKQRAYRIHDRYSSLDEGNFLTHAILEGLVGRIRWVHDTPGGRKHDLKSVKYATDLSGLVHRAIIATQRQSGIPVGYEVLEKTDWKGIQPGEILDIDWDYFACRDYPVESISARLEDFWQMPWSCVPEETYVCYSPGYSHPTRDRFEAFVQRLADRFSAAVDRLAVPPGWHSGRSRPRGPLFRAARRVYYGSGLALRRAGIY